MSDFWKGFWWGAVVGTFVGRGLLMLLGFLGGVIYYSIFG